MDQPTIVVVDDDPPFLDLLHRILRRQGYRVVSALDGQEGLAMCRREQPALVITGLVMPVMNGWELCRQLRRDTNLGGVPILVISGRSEPHHVEESLAAGATAFLPKPMRQSEVVEAVARLLQGGGPPAPSLP